MYKFSIKTNLFFGVNVVDRLGKEIQSLRYKKIGIIVDTGIYDHSQTQKAIKSLENLNLAYQVFKSDVVEPDYIYLESFKNNFSDKQFDCLVGVGGGSILDLTKGIATLITNKGNAINFQGFPDLKNQPLPLIAIPTTAGTGSEVTYNAVFTDSIKKKKLGINSEYNYPIFSMIDPLFTVGCPKSVTVSSGTDALVHTLESYVHKNHSPLSRMYSKEAFRLIYNNLTKVLENPNDILVRQNLALGAYIAGVALVNAGSGPSGAFSYPLGVYHKVPHGYAGAVFLPAVTWFNVKKGYKDYAEIYDLIEGSDYSRSLDEKNIGFAEAIDDLMEKLGVYKTIEGYDLSEGDVNFLIDQYDALKMAIAQNPIAISQEDASKIIKQSIQRGDMVLCQDSNL